MSQHDYVIDNQSSASARADLNTLFLAIASQNSGATAPATTYANQIWYDTATDLLKMRNEANSGWITLGTVDQTNNVFNPNFLPATQAEAEAGTNNVKGMTALRVAQAIAALNPAAGVNIQVFTATGTYTPTSGYKNAIGFCTGGGKGGAGNEGADASSGASVGGGAGNTAIDSFSLVSLSPQTITIGAGSSGGSASTPPSNGGTSSLGSILSASGGGATLAYTGLVQIQGGGASSTAGTTPSSGGASFWGGGGPANSAAVAFGSGGGGAFTTGNSSVSGSAGKSGIVMIMEFK
jgi:hypothetical protein